MTSIRAIVLPIAALVSVSFFSGCKPTEPSDQTIHASKVRTNEPIKNLSDMSPREVVEYAHRQRVAGKWSKLELCLLDHQRRDVIEMIQAVDKLEYANKELSKALVQRFGRAIATRFGKLSAASMAGVFSTQLQVIDAKIHGKQAVVTIQIDGGVPLDQVTLVSCDSHWCIETDPPIKGLPKELNLLAEAMVDVAKQIDVKSMTPEQAFNLLGTRIAPMKRRITRMSEQASLRSK